MKRRAAQGRANDKSKDITQADAMGGTDGITQGGNLLKSGSTSKRRS